MTGELTPQGSARIRVLVFPTDDNEPIAATMIDNSDLGIYQVLGAATLDYVYLTDVRAMVLCDESGKLRRLAANFRATRFVDRYIPGFARADTIAGPVIVVGQDDEGFPSDVPTDIERTVLG